MKKLFLLIAFTALASTAAHAQFSIGTGYLNSRNRIIDTESGRYIADKAMHGFYVGADYNIRIWRGISVEPGLNYSFMGFRESDDGFKTSWNEHFLNVPAMFKYTFDISDNFKIFGFAGPKFVVGLALTEVDKWDGNRDSYNYYTGTYKSKIAGEEETETNDPDYSRFDVQLGLGVGVQFHSFYLKSGYDWGMINRLKEFEEEAVRRGQFYIGVGYVF